MFELAGKIVIAMVRFSIRDVLWLMVVVGLGICFYQQRIQIARQQAQIKRQDQEMRKQDFRFGRLVETAAKQDVALRRLKSAESPSAEKSN